jgi:hypothetical protein
MSIDRVRQNKYVTLAAFTTADGNLLDRDTCFTVSKEST